MNKNDFFNILMNKLDYIPEKELHQIVSYYENLFDKKMSEGKSEEQIIKSLGNIDELLSNVLLHKNDYQNSHFDNDASKQNEYISNLNINYTEPSEDNSLDMTDLKEKALNKNKTTNLILKICIAVLSIVIFFPIISKILCVLFRAFGTCIGLFIGSIGLLIGQSFFNFSSIPEMPKFITDLPDSAIILFSLGTMCLGLFLFFSLCCVCKFIFILIRKIFNTFLPQEDRS